ncbi:transcriptional repressor [Tumebacillus sp. ITR2]|uniref:Transcriptional repressor n=1 Tax=Tumebacillus amylolyticus TaxID=2801339 RepID=A0ABS1JA95_9BACL|nr:Fur family transcriptional regulator [Tumebacillus amylolyticus]MBL0387204.1 transcriptional repressor [Tumebacillus amylolyticus]
MQRSSFTQTLADLKERGVRLTPQRQMILKFLKETHEHPTAEEIYKQVCQEFSGISMATVYNTLHRLKELGAIKELSYGDMSSRYDGNDTEHAHVVCESCGEVIDIALPELPTKTDETEALGYEVTSLRLEYYGLCSGCRHQVS